MSEYERNPYYFPAALGLETVGEVEWGDEPCAFDLTVVWKGEGGYYLASDSGCSCPSPFEAYTSLEKLTGPLTSHEVAASLGAQKEKQLGEIAEEITRGWHHSGDAARIESQVLSIIEKVMA
jgi:hypothetical protein